MRQPSISPKRQALLAERAQALRQSATPSEQALFRLISGRKLGVAFKRQVPIAGQFIADFLAPAARVIIEVDGPIHSNKRASDARRDRKLERLGYRVLRLEAELVLRQPEVALARIRQALAQGG